MNYDFYVNQYGGSLIPEVDFKRLSNKAKAGIDYFTFNRIDWSKADDNIKMCLCEMAEVLHQAAELVEGGIVSSETVGQYKVSYDTDVNSILAMSNQSRMNKIVAKYLVHTGLMYRGN